MCYNKSTTKVATSAAAKGNVETSKIETSGSDEKTSMNGSSSETTYGTMKKEAKRKKRILIVGAGAAGCAAAWSLINSNIRNKCAGEEIIYDVEVWDPARCAGGVATTSHFSVINEDNKASDVRTTSGSQLNTTGEMRTVEYNDGVQGGAPSYRNTLLLLESLNFQVSKLNMKVCFGVDDVDEGNINERNSESLKSSERESEYSHYHYWNNTGIPTKTIEKHKDDIKRFGDLLRFVYKYEIVFIAIKISTLLRWRHFSESFADDMVYPLVALFFGTGNQTPHVPAALIARVFLDPKLKLFEYSNATLLSESPEMFAFPSFDKLYESLVNFCEKNGNAKFKFGRRCVRVIRDKRSDKILVQGKQRSNIYEEGIVSDQRYENDETALRANKLELDNSKGTDVHEEFDHIIFACSAEAALGILKAGSGAGFFERQALGNVRYYNDITVSHTDYDYIKKFYSYGRLKENGFLTEAEGCNTGKKDPFQDKEMYLVRSYKDKRGLIEMSFDLSHYQPQVKYKQSETVVPSCTKSALNIPGMNGNGDKNSCLEADGSLFQTIFLDDKNIKDWTIDHIDETKIIKKKWWRQFAHCRGHYLGTVPFLRFIQNNKKTLYCGSWLSVNTHEQAVVSGLAAAYCISGDYFFDHDDLARDQFDLFLGIAYGKSRKNFRRKENEKNV